MRGHKAALGRLQLLCEGNGPPESTKEALVWEGRVTTVGRSAATALSVNAGLSSRCHLALQCSSSSVWCTDKSTHGSVVMEVPAGLGNSEAIDINALPWDTATHLQGQTLRLDESATTVIAVGLGTGWYAGRADMAAEVARLGAAVIAYQPIPRQQPATVAPGGSAPAAPAESVGMLEPPASILAAVKNLPFARTPGKGQRPDLLDINGRSARHGRIRAKHGSEATKMSQPPVLQSYNIFQLAAAMESKRRKQLQLQKGGKKGSSLKTEPTAGAAAQKQPAKKLRFAEPLEESKQAAAGEDEAPRRLLHRAKTLRSAEPGRKSKQAAAGEESAADKHRGQEAAAGQEIEAPHKKRKAAGAAQQPASKKKQKERRTDSKKSRVLGMTTTG